MHILTKGTSFEHTVVVVTLIHTIFVSAVLLHILQNLIEPSQQTLVFTATKHHVEYLKEVPFFCCKNVPVLPKNTEAKISTI